MVLNKYRDFLEHPHRRSLRQAYVTGLLFALGQMVQFLVNALIFYSGAHFLYDDSVDEYKDLMESQGLSYNEDLAPTTGGDDLFIAILAVFFGAFAVG